MKWLGIVFSWFVVGLASSAATYFYLESRQRSEAMQFDARWRTPEDGGKFAASVVTPMSYLDDTAKILSIAERKALFVGFSEQLYDPASAQVRRLRRSNNGMICGEVNARNKMGGYVGFTPFTAILVD